MNNVTVYENPQPTREGATNTVYVERKTNGLAITSRILSIIGLGLLGVIFGHIALRSIRTTGDSGSGFAIPGLIIGYFEVVAVTIAVLIIGGSIIWAVNA